MYLEYSYGWLGYFLKYFGGLVFLMMGALFLAIPFAIVIMEYYKKELFDSIVLIVASLIMTPFCFKGVYYLFRFSGSFTKKYVFTDTKLVIMGLTTTEEYYYIDFQKIVYFKFVKLFEIYVGASPKPIVIMINGQHETQDFLDLKNVLYNSKVTVHERFF